MIYQLLLVISFALMVLSHPTGSPPTGSPPTGSPSTGSPPTGKPHDQFRSHHGGPPKCLSDQQLGQHSNEQSSEQEGNGNNQGHNRGPPPAMGPISPIYCNLTQEKRQQVDKIVESNINSTKAVLKSSLDSFVSGLSTELQQEVTDSKQRFENMKANMTAKIATLSSAAQALSSQIEAVFADETLSFPAECQKLHSIIESADPTVINEFVDNHIPLPGFFPPRRPQQGNSQ